MIITISTPDEFYYKQLLVFLVSLRKFNPYAHTTVYLDGHTYEQIAFLREKFWPINFEYRTINKVDNRGIHYILLRIELLLECLYRGDNAVWIDTDVIIRGDLKEFLTIEPKQLKILFRGEEQQEKVRFNAGVLNIGSSEETISFVERWKERLLNNMTWGMGQLELYRAYQEHKGSIELVPMSSDYNDLGCSIKKPEEFFREDSMIWHCKKGHFDNPRFQKEFQHYLNIAERY